MLLLEEREHALARGARIYAELAGYGSSCDAGPPHRPRRDRRGSGAGDAASRWRTPGSRPSEVGYVNAHATSTTAGDIAEARAIALAGLGGAAVSSTKSAHGHALGGAGGPRGGGDADGLRARHPAGRRSTSRTPSPRRPFDHVLSPRSGRASARRSPTRSASAATTPAWCSPGTRDRPAVGEAARRPLGDRRARELLGDLRRDDAPPRPPRARHRPGQPGAGALAARAGPHDAVPAAARRPARARPPRLRRAARRGGGRRRSVGRGAGGVELGAPRRADRRGQEAVAARQPRAGRAWSPTPGCATSPRWSTSAWAPGAAARRCARGATPSCPSRPNVPVAVGGVTRGPRRLGLRRRLGCRRHPVRRPARRSSRRRRASRSATRPRWRGCARRTWPGDHRVLLLMGLQHRRAVRRRLAVRGHPHR